VKIDANNLAAISKGINSGFFTEVIGIFVAIDESINKKRL